MLIYVNITTNGQTDSQTYQKYSSEQKCFSSDRRTDTRSTQNYSSEPHKI